jgi:hypothetical protein
MREKQSLTTLKTFLNLEQMEQKNSSIEWFSLGLFYFLISLVYHHMSSFTTPKSLAFDVKRIGVTFSPTCFLKQKITWLLGH